ncbi:MAG: ATP-dependent DNA ligase [Candidatus Aenigmatarchaeota archaeon]
MEYSILVNYYEKLEKTSSKIEKTKILAELFKNCEIEDLEKVVYLVQGIVYPKYMQIELGIATQLMMTAISKVVGISVEKVEEEFARTGDLGLTAEKLLPQKRQITLFKKNLTVEMVFENLRKVSLASGEGAQERKIQTIYSLLLLASPKEAKYLVRTILGELRIGVAEGLIRDAIVEAFFGKNEKAYEAVDYAWNILSDFALVAKIAKEKGIEGLENVKIEFGRPIQVMLGEKAESIEEVVKEFGKVAAEWKYDGMRTLIMKKGSNIKLFTRRQEDVTKQFPDLCELCLKGINADECVIEGETIAVNPQTGEPMAFQVLSRRIHRKYEIEEMIKKIPIRIHLFDVVYLNGEMLIDKPLIERRKILENIVKEIPGKFELAKQIISDNIQELESFYQSALKAKQEGLMLKVLNSPYKFGRHVGGWYKIKPTMETLDLVIIGATWGEGSRANWLTSYELAVRDPDTGNFLRCGMMSTGLTEEEYEMMTELLKPLIIQEKGKEVKIRPKIVIEVKYQEIQKSPNYESGYALRFPAFVRIRDDKGPEEADTLDRLIELYKSQGKAG